MIDNSSVLIIEMKMLKSICFRISFSTKQAKKIFKVSLKIVPIFMFPQLTEV